MYKFTDSRDRQWTLAVSVGSARAVLAATGVNIYGLPQERFQGLIGLVGDPYKLLEVAWVLCAASTKEHASATREDFEAAIDGPALERLAAAVLEAIPDFFSDAPTRENLRNLIAKAKRLGDRVLEAQTARVQALDPDRVDVETMAQIPAATPEAEGPETEAQAAAEAPVRRKRKSPAQAS